MQAVITQCAEVEPEIYTPGICVIVSRLQDAVSLVSLFHMIHPRSESAQEAASQQAAGTDLLKVRTPALTRRIPGLYSSEIVPGVLESIRSQRCSVEVKSRLFHLRFRV